MKNESDKTPKIYKKLKHQLTEKGSLGLLAYGDIAVMAWKQLKNAPKK